MEETTTPNTSTPPTQSPMKMVAIVGVIIVIGLIAYTVLNKPDSSSEIVDVTPLPTSLLTVSPTSSPSTSEAPSTDAITTIDLEAGSFYYKPAEIRVKKGEKVKIVMKSADMMHDFNIDELNVKLPITRSGETNTVEFTPDKTGTFEYYCSVGQHRARGQVGKIIVE